ncbi:MAG: WYL domain-containing protein [Dokdonella sp.]|uniref:WYL domain-containing protein n=1 Tax=Dokdonella sp. TaxID=2291710 RepID=UPI0025C1D8B7|nr:WYL domain-containing protein [Dokdonella sp.]MBZ0223276.1 WYL domain-containing protein [Dokdonella sp.]
MQFERIRRNVVERLTFIEQRLYWEGRFQKADLTNRFSISVPQASADVAHYQRLAPENTVYDAAVRAFVPTPKFKPALMVPDARTYLSQLLLLADDALKPSESWLGAIPSHAAIPKVRRRLNPEVLRSVVQAIQKKCALEVLYQSFSTPEPKRRWVAPHGLAFDGFRWHARVWCYTKSGFIDLVLARFLEIGQTRQAEVDGALDRLWNEIVQVRLAPHPELPTGPRRAIELDYGMENGVIDVPMRLALYYYFERHLCLDIEARPERKQVVVLNRDEIEAALSGSGSVG